MERLGLTTEMMRRGARTYKKVHTNWPQGPERSFAARRLHSTAMYLGTATATATVPTSRLLATPAHPHACFSSCSLGSLNSLSLKHRVPISLPVVAAGGDRHSPHLTRPRPDSPAGYSQLHLVLHPGSELLAFFRSHSRSRSTKHPSPHVKSPPLAALSALRLHVFARTPTGKQSVRRAVVADWHLAHNPTPVEFLLDPLTCQADILLQRHTATQSGFRHKSPHLVVQGLMRDDSMIHGHRATSLALASQQHVVTCNAAL
jgi:hypothetical protein